MCVYVYKIKLSLQYTFEKVVTNFFFLLMKMGTSGINKIIYTHPWWLRW